MARIFFKALQRLKGIFGALPLAINFSREILKPTFGLENDKN